MNFTKPFETIKTPSSFYSIEIIKTHLFNDWKSPGEQFSTEHPIFVWSIGINYVWRRCQVIVAITIRSFSIGLWIRNLQRIDLWKSMEFMGSEAELTVLQSSRILVLQPSLTRRSEDSPP